jgi:four helix bundle protein
MRLLIDSFRQITNGMNKVDFAAAFRNRTKDLALKTLILFRSLNQSEETKFIGKQLMRCSSSVAANYRAACRARSRAEFFSKICIVVEEADETLFWLEVLEESRLVPIEQIGPLKKEATEILYMTARARKTAQNKGGKG